MALLTSLTSLSWIAKTYAVYSYSLAFLLQSSICLCLAIAATLAGMILRRQSLRQQQSVPHPMVRISPIPLAVQTHQHNKYKR